VTACPRTATDVPITEAAGTFERLWVERAVAEAFAICPTCRAFGTAPCRTPRGRVVPDHKARGRS
jgi:hypothetical protein